MSASEGGEQPFSLATASWTRASFEDDMMTLEAPHSSAASATPYPKPEDPPRTRTRAPWSLFTYFCWESIVCSCLGSVEGNVTQEGRRLLVQKYSEADIEENKVISRKPLYPPFIYLTSNAISGLCG